MSNITTAQSGPGKINDRSLPPEASKLIELTWGTWRERYTLGLSLALVSFLLGYLGALTGNAAPSFTQAILPAAQVILLSVAFMILPAMPINRVVAISLAWIGLGLQMWLFPQIIFRGFGGPSWLQIGILLLAPMPITAAWLTIRHRPVWAFIVVLPLSVILPWLNGRIALDFYDSASYGPASVLQVAVSAAVVLVTWAIRAWGAWAIDLAVRTHKQRRQNIRSGATLAKGAFPTLYTGTNALAIASFISVWFVSVAGIVMGHVALSQIKRTGQQGRGLALAAVIIGWISLGVAIAIIIALMITVGARPTSSGFAQD